MLASAVLSLALTQAAFADPQAIRQGDDLTAAQVGHAFAAGCAATQPLRLETALPLWSEAFWFSAQQDTDSDYAFVSPNGEITVAADVSALAASCTMAVSAAIGGDGSEIYESLEAHLAKRWWRDSPVETEVVDGGLVWSYTRKGVSHQVRFVENGQGFVITHEVAR